jgi:O-antigen ligase
MQSGRSVDLSLTGKQGAALVFVALFLGVSLLTLQYVFSLGLTLLQLAAAGSVACAIGLIVFALPKYGLMIGLFYIYAGMSAYFGFPAGYPIVALVTAAVVVDLLRGGQIELRSPGFNWAVILFLMIAVQSMLYAYDLDASVYKLAKILRALVMIYLVVQLVRTPRDLHQYAQVIYFGTLASVVLGLLNLVFGWVEFAQVIPGSSAQGIGLRFAGTHGNPNEYGAYLATSLPIGIYLARVSRRWYSRLTIAFGAVLILSMLFSTFSRAAVLLLGFVVVAILVRDVRSKAVFAFVVAAVAAVLATVPVQYWNRLSTLQDVMAGETADWSFYLRLKSMEVAWKLFQDHPFTGVGLGNFVTRSAPYFFQRKAVHNVYLQILANLGIFGFLAYMAMCGSVASHFLKAIRTRWSKQDERMRHLLFYMFVAWLTALFGDLFGPRDFEYLMWLLAAGGLAAGRIALRTRRQESGTKDAD